MKGWECPVCGKGLAPWVKECDCKEDPTELKQPIFPNYDPWPGYVPPRTDNPYPWSPYIVTCDGSDLIWMIDMKGTQI